MFGSPKEARKCDPFIHYGVAAAIEALKDSGLEITDANADQVGVHVGSGIGGIGTIEDTVRTLDKGGVRKVSPFFVPSSIINMISGNISILTGARGPNLATVTACTTGAHCIGLSARLIAAGDAEVMIAGGAERGSSPAGLAGSAQPVPSVSAMTPQSKPPGPMTRTEMVLCSAMGQGSWFWSPWSMLKPVGPTSWPSSSVLE